MLRLFRTILVVFATFFANAALAQQYWVQVEAQPSLQSAQERAAAYAGQIANVQGFRLGNSDWRAIVIGPFDETTANQQRTALRREARIPRDSFVTDGRSFNSQFWPIGSAGASIAPVAPAPAPAQPTQTPSEPVVAPAPPEPTGETLAEARRSEAQLTQDERKDLQIALQWDGFYNAAIDGAFGRGTRASMADWQQANGHEATGVLTTRQRAELLAAYNAILAGIGMETVRDDVAGIEIDLPLELIGFDSYEPPFAHYGAHDGAARPKALLISQKGDVDTLFGLYDIMQTLEIVPEQGAREKRRDSFTLIGEGPDFISQTEAVVRDGAVKGFTLIWPKNDEKRRQRVIDEMTSSFVALPGAVMDDMVGEPTENQRIDLLAGLEIRSPEVNSSGFYVDARGRVLTAANTVQSCSRITLNEEVEATLKASDPASGLAVLEPSQALAPRAFARFQPAVPRLQSDVVLSGYSYGGILGAPSLTFGVLADLRGLSGEETIKRYDLAAQPSDVGGPILDTSGAVLGMLMPNVDQNGRALPGDVSFAVDVETIADFLSNNSMAATAAERTGPVKAGVLNDIAVDMTVLVSCWR
ncbi:serine protease [Oceaniglobus ichthyenteri]|uniref:serine protease n=1 Tax=Oceaniglobus ichthyenteri TaxID=2136177 RepID=UPI000D379EDD|nr:serine protease [Oceaniglobus ichthyenteri]